MKALNPSTPPADRSGCAGVSVSQLCKSFGDLPVLEHISFTLKSGGTYCLMGPSGSGKTTLLRLILGLETPDAGTIIRPERLTAVFQEDRLCESFSPVDNVALAAVRIPGTAAGSLPKPGVSSRLHRSQIRSELCRILPEESLSRPVRTLSGGMKRRVAIARALLAPSDGILMDEPFTGLDETTRRQVISYIKEKAAGKLLLVTTHQEEDARLLKADILRPF